MLLFHDGKALFCCFLFERGWLYIADIPSFIFFSGSLMPPFFYPFLSLGFGIIIIPGVGLVVCFR